MTITASLVNELRQRTGVGMMECKKALQETNGDVDPIGAASCFIRSAAVRREE